MLNITQAQFNGQMFDGRRYATLFVVGWNDY
jgi:hypothetical protein